MRRGIEERKFPASPKVDPGRGNQRGRGAFSWISAVRERNGWMSMRKESGFTLIETVIALAILTLLGAAFLTVSDAGRRLLEIGRRLEKTGRRSGPGRSAPEKDGLRERS